MKRHIKLSEIIKIAIPVIAIIATILTMYSCATSHTNCDAYGQNDTKYNDVLEIEKS